MSKVSMFVFMFFAGVNAFAMNCQELTSETQLAYDGSQKYIHNVMDSLSGKMTKENCSAVNEYLEFHQEGIRDMLSSLGLQLKNLQYNCPQASIQADDNVISVDEAIEDIDTATLALDVADGILQDVGESCKKAGL